MILGARLGCRTPHKDGVRNTESLPGNVPMDGNVNNSACSIHFLALSTEGV